MKYWHSGITVWHGTSDAPAPETTAPAGVPILITVGVRPINPANVVTVRYRVGATAPREVRARLVDTDYAASTQYFEASLPAAPAGTLIHFVAVCECNGRQAPNRATAAALPAAFTVTADAAPIARRQVTPRIARPQPRDLETARERRRNLEARLQSLRRSAAQSAQALSDRRRRLPPDDESIAMLVARVQEQGERIAETLDDLRSLGYHVRALKPLPRDVNVPLPGVSDRHPVLLFPVRIETRFDTSDVLVPKLMVRIYPDQLAIDAHHDGLSTAELGDGQAWLDESTAASATDETRRAAWRKLAAQHGSRRAAWIAEQMGSSTPPVPLGNDPILPPPRVYVLPDYFVVTLYRDSTIAYQKFAARIDDQLAVLWDRQEITSGDAELFDAGTQWMSDFKIAESVGMAATIDLIPSDLDAGFTHLTVVGLRASEAAGTRAVQDLIDHHHYTDGFAFLPPGTPTNNTSTATSLYSESNADGDFDFDVERQPPEPDGERDARSNGACLANALGIDVRTFDFIEGRRSSEWSRAREMQTALWPATGEYTLRYMLPNQMSEATREQLERHFREFVRARGPLPLVRIGKQPYGVLPVSKVRGWVPSAKDTPDGVTSAATASFLDFHRRLHAVLMVFFADWIKLAARERLVPRIGDGDDDPDGQLLAVLGMAPGTLEVRARPVLDERLVAIMLPIFLHDAFTGRQKADALSAGKEALERWGKSWDELKAPTLDQLRQLATAVGVPFAPLASAPLVEAFGWSDAFRLTIPLVQSGPTSPPEYLGPLSRNVRFARLGSNDTVLAELLTHGVKRARDAAPVRSAISELSRLPTDVLTGLLTDVLDLCSYRLDAWITSLAYARLHAMRRETPSGLHVGAYGWVEDLRPRPAADNDSAGYIHAPSVAHGAAAAVLRNAFLTHRGSAQENPFAINLTSERVRRALELIDGVRTGQELSAILGYQFERGLHDGHRDVYIAKFREAFPKVANKETPGAEPDPVEAIAARNVVDGLALATAWRAARGTASQPVTSFTLPAVAKGAVVVSDAAVIEELESLIDSLDSVGDVLLTEGVFQTVQGNYERAGAALDALAGVSAPPDLEAVRTPLPGVSFEHRVCTLFGTAEATLPPNAGPRALAEPRLAAWVAEMMGPASAIECRATYTPEGNSSSVTLTLTVADLGLDAVDLMYASAFPVSGELTELERRIGYHVMSTAGVASGSAIEIDVRRAEAHARGLGEAMEVGRHVLDLIGGAQPLTPEGLVLPEQVHAGPTFDSDSYLELRDRVQHAEALLSGTVQQVETGLAAVTDGSRIDLGDAGTPTLAQSLLALSRFGLDGAIPDSPVLVAEQRPRIGGAVNEAKTRLAKCTDARSVSANALTAPPPPSDDPDEPTPEPSQSQRYAKAVSLLGEAMKALFGTHFVALPTFTVGAAAGQELRQAQAQVHVVAGDQTECVLLWLQQAAQTHRGLGRLEDVLLASEAWRTAAVPANAEAAGAGAVVEFDGSAHTLRVAQLPHDPDLKWLALSDDELGSSDRRRGRVSIVSLQLGSLDPRGRLAGFMIEQWQETIPGEDVTTGVSFHFDRPNSLAPQSILLAVPHTWGADAANWCLADLVEIVRDTATLARVRLVDPDALRRFDRLLPALFVPQDVDRPAYPREVKLPDIRQVVARAATL